MQRLLAQPRADATLCHGLSGPAEISFTAGLRIDDPSFGSSATATDRVLLDRHSVDDDWPSGLACKGPNPSFSARPVSDSIFSVATIPARVEPAMDHLMTDGKSELNAGIPRGFRPGTL